MFFKDLDSTADRPRDRTFFRTCARMVFWTAAFVLLAGSLPASAQEKFLGAAPLTENTESLSLAPYAVIQSDPQGKITPQLIESTAGQVLTGSVPQSDMINLGYNGEPVWITLKLGNTSLQENWIVDMGTRSEGRLGYIESAKAYILNVAHDQPASVYEIPPLSNKGVFKVRIPQSTQSYVILNILPGAGKPSVVPLKIYSEPAYIQHVASSLTPYGIFAFVMIAYALFFLSMAIMNSQRLLLVYTAYFLHTFMCWTVLENLGAIIGFSLLDIIIPVFLLGFTLFLIGLSKIFFDIEYGSFTERYVLYGLAWLNILSTLLSFLLPVSGGLTQICLLYGAPLVTFFMLSLMAFLQSTQGEGQAQRLYFFGSLFPLLGLIIVILQLFHVLPLYPIVINALFYLLAFQGLFILAAVRKKILLTGHISSSVTLHSDQMQFTRLRETRDSADHTRLLKVIEKEREQLAEFRAKDIERVNEMRSAIEEADEANRAKSAFLAVVSHEIRTPMTGVMGMVRLLLDSNITKQQRDYVLTIQESSEAMMSLLNDILDFEKIQRGRIELENMSFDLQRLIQSVITLMSGHAADKNVILSARVDDDLPRYVKGDPTRLRQVLLNLMGNAIKFTDKGSVTLIVKNMDQGDEYKTGDRPMGAEKHLIYFAVQDTGIGIPSEAKKNLFTPFAQANSSINRKFGGSGLGLAISKGLIETMGGTININSKEGDGSTFFFTLEMRPGLPTVSETLVKPVETQYTLPPTRIRILIVDDNTITRKVILGFLGKDGHEIYTAGTAEDALKKINQNAFDLIFMDIELPGMKGNEAVRILRDSADPVKSSVPVIAITGNIAKEDMEQYLSDGMSGFIAKPIDAEKLRAIVNEVAHETFEREIRMPDPFLVPPAIIENKPARSEPFAYDKDIFNPDMLQSLKDTIGAKQLDELLTDLVVKTEEIVAAMVEASKRGDLATLAARAHELKGMTGNFGLVEISAIAAQAERKVKTQDTADLGTLVGTLSGASQRAQSALKDWSAY